MPKFSRRSRNNLDTCHMDLVALFNKVVRNYDCTILEGRRTKNRQIEMVRTGKSQTLNSRHVAIPPNPSMAVDVAPYPISFSNSSKNIARYYHFAGYVFCMAHRLSIPLRWGGDWDGDFDFSDQVFNDLVHFEIRRK